MAKKSKSSRRDQSGPDVLFLRVDPELGAWLASLAESTGKSRNELACGALAQFREVMAWVEKMRSDNRGDYVGTLGASWVSRLLAMGLGDEVMEWDWRDHLARWERLRKEIDEDRKGRK